MRSEVSISISESSVLTSSSSSSAKTSSSTVEEVGSFLSSERSTPESAGEGDLTAGGESV